MRQLKLPHFTARHTHVVRTTRAYEQKCNVRVVTVLFYYSTWVAQARAPTTKLSMVRHAVVQLLGCGCSGDSSDFRLPLFLSRRSRTPVNPLGVCTRILPNHSRTTKVGWTYAIVSGSYRGRAQPEPGSLSDFTQQRMTYRFPFRRMGILSPPSRGIKAHPVSVKRQP